MIKTNWKFCHCKIFVKPNEDISKTFLALKRMFLALKSMFLALKSMFLCSFVLQNLMKHGQF